MGMSASHRSSIQDAIRLTAAEIAKVLDRSVHMQNGVHWPDCLNSLTFYPFALTGTALPFALDRRSNLARGMTRGQPRAAHCKLVSRFGASRRPLSPGSDFWQPQPFSHVLDQKHAE